MKKTVAELVDVVLVPFMEIKPSDVLLLKNLINHLHVDGFRTQGEYFLWAQQAGSLADIWLEAKSDDVYDSIEDFVKSCPPLPQLRMEACLSDFNDEGGEGKSVSIPLTVKAISDEFHSFEPALFGYRCSEQVVSRVNYEMNYFGKQCWVLRSRVKSDLTPLALSFFISIVVRKSQERFKELSDIIKFIRGIKIDVDELRLFEKNQAESYAKSVKYSYRRMVGDNHVEEWLEVLKIVESPVIRLVDLANPFKKMGLAYWGIAKEFDDLNRDVGALFLSQSDYELFIQNGGLGYTFVGSWSSENLKNLSAKRGLKAIQSFYDVYLRFREKFIDCSSSPMERIFAKLLLRCLPERNVIHKRVEIVQEKLFLCEHGSNIERGKKVYAGSIKAGHQNKAEKSERMRQIVSTARERVIEKHIEFPWKIFGDILECVATELDVKPKTLRNYGVIKKSFPEW
ncbi:hypothetical protein [Halodesulfovibrio spirochaetisodalis]|uniref:Uncharacterized protein n=1 Tax=Halodesulfovibrio spirochaetisodalis TaxID=1560234 RepID=A0A1B7XML6_9BACT|nr:hypothetical protein [Halodesulfovibrio spirochaetisodalis]OBQ56754.1 hypothetical protein SP90_01320 [Halodesulfovibrio spirochaetisodalis]